MLIQSLPLSLSFPLMYTREEKKTNKTIHPFTTQIDRKVCEAVFSVDVCECVCMTWR